MEFDVSADDTSAIESTFSPPVCKFKLTKMTVMVGNMSMMEMIAMMMMGPTLQDMEPHCRR